MKKSDKLFSYLVAFALLISSSVALQNKAAAQITSRNQHYLMGSLQKFLAQSDLSNTIKSKTSWVTNELDNNGQVTILAQQDSTETTTDDDSDDEDEIEYVDPEDIEVYKDDLTLSYSNFSSTDEYNDAFSWFNSSDEDFNLTLDTEEVIYAFELEGLEIDNCTAKFLITVVDGYFGHQYRDNNLKIDEWDLLLEILTYGTEEEQAIWYYKAFDENQDNGISPHEWDEMIDGFLFAPDDSTFDDVDLDGDGSIDIDEWEIWMGVTDDEDEETEEDDEEETEEEEVVEEDEEEDETEAEQEVDEESE